MSEEEILSNLCTYDPRNPNYFYDKEWNIGYKEPPKNCICDNCFYSRTKLASEVLKYKNAIKDAWEMGAAYGTAEDDILPEAVERQKEFIKQN